MRRSRHQAPANLASQATVAVSRRPSARAVAAGERSALPDATARVRDTLILRAVRRAQSDADCAR